MKKLVLYSISVMVLLGLSAGCDKLDRLTQFHLSYSETVTISSMLGINLPFNIATPAIKTNSSEIFEVNDTRKDLIEEIRIEQVTLTVVAPEDADFSFLNSIEIFIKTDDLDEILIAWSYDMDNSIGNTISLDLTEDDLTAYVISDEIEMRLSTVTDKVILSDIDIRLDVSFFVNARILGI